MKAKYKTNYYYCNGRLYLTKKITSMKKYLLLCMTILYIPLIYAQDNVNTKAFELLDLSQPGLAYVKKAYDKGKYERAAKELLKYYRTRTSFNHPDLDLSKLQLSEKEQKWADDGLEHVFFAHKGYQPSYFYGEDIDWAYWPIKDNELRWQLHRTKWWQPMGKAYYLSKDEKYAKEWTFQYLDWIRKNPLEEYTNRQQVGADVESLPNSAFAWRPLEVSHRLQDQIEQFILFNGSKHFTPAFLTHFLVNYEQHAQHILANYSEKGNHLLFEAQRIFYAGTCFHEFKDASKWRASGIAILNDEIEEQVYPDGGQFELDLGYHLAAINIFAKALRMAQANGFGQEFPSSYAQTIHAMIEVVENTYFPDYTNPLFSDAKMGNPQSLVANYKSWQQLFPNDEIIRYFASEHKEGEAPNYLSKPFKDSGFYVLRNGWSVHSTQMVMKAGPAAFWHNQPDNGTFELYVDGRNFFPDSGSYVYGGSDEVLRQRAWFRQTKVHNTLTLNNLDIDSNSTCLYWNTSPKLDVVVVENNSYSQLSHRRTVYFVDQSFYVILDEAIGDATGSVAIHYNLCEGDFQFDLDTMRIQSNFDDANNLILQVFAPNKLELKEQEGWVSYAYRQKSARPAFEFSQSKKDGSSVQFVTVIIPTHNKGNIDKIEASLVDDGIEIQLDDETFHLNYPLEK